MKRIIPLIIVFIFSMSLFAQNEDTLLGKSRKIRTITLEDVYSIDSTFSVSKSPLLVSFEGIGITPVKEAYRLNRQIVDSILAADSLNPNFWRVYSYQAVNTFVTAKKSPQLAMSIFLPWFLLILFIVIVVHIVKIYFIHTHLLDPEAPENAAISTSEGQDNEQNEISGEEATKVQ